MTRPLVKRRVVLVDDHNLIRRGLAALLVQRGGFEVVDEAQDGVEALARIGKTPCDLMIVDLAMPRIGGIDLITEIRRQNRRVRILVLSMYDDAQFVARAMKAGADGFLLKQGLEYELFRAIDAVFDGEEFISDSIDVDAVREFTIDDCELTAREKEVLSLIAEGKTNNDIAECLAISPHTVTRHRANLMRKLDAHNGVELINIANHRGLIMLPRSSEL